MDVTAYADNADNLRDYIRLCGLFLWRGDSDEQENIATEIAQLADEIAKREALTNKIALSMPLLRETLALDGAEWFCAVLGICCAMDGDLSNKVMETIGSAIPSFDLALALYGKYRQECLFPTFLSFIDEDNSTLRYVFEPVRAEHLSRAMFKPMIPRKNVLYFLASGVMGNRRFYRISYPNGSYLPLHSRIYDVFLQTIQDAFSSKKPQLLFLTGPAGCGKLSLTERVATEAGRPLIFPNLDEAAVINNLSDLYEELALDTVLCGGTICVRQYTPEHASLLHRILQVLPVGVPVTVHSDIEDCPAPVISGRTTLHRTLGVLNGADYSIAASELWKRFELSGESLPNHYRLTIGQMERVFLDVRARCTEDGRDIVEQRDFAQAVRALGGDSKAHVIETVAAFKDLVAIPETMERLRAICTLARGWRDVTARYNAADTISYGKGVTALFYGPSGTGKTLAASAIANELGLELWHIDLSAVLDKYIGETEKHLAEVFASARKRNCILFFDEADALFSKRTTVSTSNDRYANVGTSFLLQCVEDYDGIILLATNLYQNIDTAFLRRLSIIVRFAVPDKSLRLELWQRAFPQGISLDEAVELPFLAEELELTPAEIRGAAQTAAVLADGKAVSPPNLLYALEIEMEKSGRSGTFQEFRELWGAAQK